LVSHDILVLLANKGPLNKFHICRELKTHASEPTILYAVRDLEANGRVEAVKTDRNARGPTGQSKYYDLTAKGLRTLINPILPTKGKHLKSKLALQESSFRNLAKKYRDFMPEIFNYWPTFLKIGAENIAIMRLITVVEDLSGYDFLADDPEILGDKFRPLSETEYLEKIVDGFWTLDWPDHVDEDHKLRAREIWLNAIRKDTSLREMIVRIMNRRLEDLARERNESVKQIIAQAPEIGNLISRIRIEPPSLKQGRQGSNLKGNETTGSKKSS